MTAPQFTPLDGDDVEDIIAENGGVGEFETEDSAGQVERWSFPRFAGAEDPNDMYLSRSGIGEYDTDVETVVGWAEAPRNIVGAVNLLGHPGTGKTALIEAAATHAEADLLTWLCTPDDTRDSLYLRYVGEGHGEGGTPFALGPIPMAAKVGKWLYLDEWMMLLDGVKPVVYSLSDGRRYLPGGNVDGTPMEIHPDFRLILSSNPLVRGASMPEPMASRCASTTLTVETNAAMLRDLGIDESIVQAWEALRTEGLWQPQIRELKIAHYWLEQGEAYAAQAASAFLPEHCPESQRAQVRNTVISYLGGHLRPDGRLVVA
jgi:MoxR-like ATPase